MSLSNQLKKASLRTAFGYLEKNPEENALKLMSWVDKLAGEGPDSFPTQRAAVRNVLEDSQNNMYQLVRSGQIRSIKNGRNILIPRCALIEFLSTAC